MRSFLLTVEHGRLILTALDGAFMCAGREVFRCDRAITEIAATLKQLEEELLEAASGVTVEEDAQVAQEAVDE